MKRKQLSSKPPKYFIDFVEKNNKVLQQILDRLTKIESLQTKDHQLLLKVNRRLDNTIKLNDLKTK